MDRLQISMAPPSATIHSPRRGKEKKPLKTIRGFFCPPPPGGGVNGYPPSWVGLLLLIVVLMGDRGINGAAVCHAAESERDKWFRSAEQGDIKAQLKLGQIFYEGEGIQQDYGQAMHWFRLAAEQGNAEAQNSVGTLYDNGKGVPRDFREAAKWFRLAADQGHLLARRNLGWMYEKGQGFKQDYRLAYVWHYWAEKARLERKGGRDDGIVPCRFCDALLRKMTPEQIVQAKKMVQNGGLPP